MKKLILLLLFLLNIWNASAQIDGELLLGLVSGTTTEINNITNPVAGTLVYNSEEGKMYINTGTGFVKIPSIDTNSIDFWNSTGNAGIDPLLHFLGTTDVQDMVFRANSEERIRLSGANQTVRINGAVQFNNHPFIIRANNDDILAFQTATGVTEWHWNLVGNGLNFVETGVADYRIFMEQGGNVGIDTGTPSEKLDVNGNLRVRNITTTTSDLDVLVTTATGVVQKRSFSDFSGTPGPTTNIGARWTNTDTTTDLNIDNQLVPIFGAADYKDDTANSLYEIIGNALTVKETGRYDIRANIALLGINSDGTTERHTSVNAKLYINGTPIGSLAASGYIRYQTNHRNSSIHINEILQLQANDIISIETLAEANSGIVNFSGTNESNFTINKIK